MHSHRGDAARRCRGARTGRWESLAWRVSVEMNWFWRRSNKVHQHYTDPSNIATHFVFSEVAVILVCFANVFDPQVLKDVEVSEWCSRILESLCKPKSSKDDRLVTIDSCLPPCLERVQSRHWAGTIGFPFAFQVEQGHQRDVFWQSSLLILCYIGDVRLEYSYHTALKPVTTWHYAYAV